jgi:hypothetical protein
LSISLKVLLRVQDDGANAAHAGTGVPLVGVGVEAVVGDLLRTFAPVFLVEQVLCKLYTLGVGFHFRC